MYRAQDSSVLTTLIINLYVRVDTSLTCYGKTRRVLSLVEILRSSSFTYVL